MKKSIIALTLIVVATVSMMTSCTKDEKPLTLSDLAGYTFEGKQVNDDDKSEIKFMLTFHQTEQAFTFVTSQPFTSAGTYEISGTSVILKYPAGNTETLKSDGPKKLIYRVKDKDVVLTRK